MSESTPPAPKDLRPTVLDEIDRRIVRLLSHDGRMSNQALADECGIAPSTCLARVRALRESGVIKRFVAQIDPAALGRPIEALVAIRLQPDARPRIDEIFHYLNGLPGVMEVYFLAGAVDFQVHVAARDTADLQDLVVGKISSTNDVAVTETNLIFEHSSTPML